MFCPQCGTKLVEGSRFCYRCGCRLADYVPEFRDLPPARTGRQPSWAEGEEAEIPAVERTRPGYALDSLEGDQPQQPQDETSPRQPVILIDRSHKERIHEDHWTALTDRLREEGRVATRTRRPVNPAVLRSKKMLLIAGPEHRWVFGRGADRWQDEEVRAIKRFVARGNALWVMGDGLCDAEALSKVTEPYGIAFFVDPVGAVTVSAQDIYRHRLTRGVDEICLGSVRGVGGNYLTVDDPAVVLAEHGGRAVMACCAHGDGRVLVLSSLSAFSQRHIEDKDNPVLLSNILHYLLRFAPPAKPSQSPVREATEIAEPAVEQATPPMERSTDGAPDIGLPGSSLAGRTTATTGAERAPYRPSIPSASGALGRPLPAQEPAAPGEDRFAALPSDDVDESTTAIEPDETDESDEWEEWDDAYN
jgi:hypothetical protein